jgi:hypothetical protein
MRRRAAATPPAIARTVTIIARTGGAVNRPRGDRAHGHKFAAGPSCPATINTYGAGRGTGPTRARVA